MSKLDYADPVFSVEAGKTCGKGETAWNTVADSPFAIQASVNNWEELPALLDQLWNKPDEYIQRLQASDRGHCFVEVAHNIHIGELVIRGRD